VVTSTHGLATEFVRATASEGEYLTHSRRNAGVSCPGFTGGLDLGGKGITLINPDAFVECGATRLYLHYERIWRDMALLP
jgi:hypothetical protein